MAPHSDPEARHMTPEQLRAIRRRAKDWDIACIFADRQNLLAEVDRLRAALKETQ